jgi:hypothetical protein
MILDFNENKPVAVVLGAGAMAMAIVRRVAAGAKVLLGDVSEKNLERAAEAMRFNGYDVETMVVNALDKEQVYAFATRAAELGDVMWFVDTAGASPSQATPQFIIDLDLIGTSYALDAFGPVMARGGAGHVDSQPAEVTKCALNAEPGRTRAAQCTQKRTFTACGQVPNVQSCVQSGEVYAGADALRRESGRRCPKPRTVRQGVRRDGHLRPTPVGGIARKDNSGPRLVVHTGPHGVTNLFGCLGIHYNDTYLRKW